jgi:hypothetical protein
LLACDKTSWVAYLDAFEVAIDVALRNSDYLNLPLSNLRYSVVDDAVAGLGSVLAIKNMRYKGVWDKSLFPQNGTDADPNKMTQLLLIALRVLPKLPYYLAADKWRLHLLENGFDNMNEEWWRFRLVPQLKYFSVLILLILQERVSRCGGNFKQRDRFPWGLFYCIQQTLPQVGTTET